MLCQPPSDRPGATAEGGQGCETTGTPGCWREQDQLRNHGNGGGADKHAWRCRGSPGLFPGEAAAHGHRQTGVTAHCGTTGESEKPETAEVHINRPVENKLEHSCFGDTKHLLKWMNLIYLHQQRQIWNPWYRVVNILTLIPFLKTHKTILYCLWLQVDLTVLNESFKRLMEKENIHFRTTSYPGEEWD